MWLSAAISPRITALADALATHVPDALSAFWTEVDREGTPLVEPIPDDPESVIVTFLWRAVEPVTTTVAPRFGDRLS